MPRVLLVVAKGIVLVALLLASGCTGVDIARFEPLSTVVTGERVACGGWSIVVPTGWRVVEGPGAGGLRAVEDPPDNGRLRIYRSLELRPLPSMPAEQFERRGAELLRRRHERDRLDVERTGLTGLAAGECVVLRGSISGGAADVRLDVLEYLVRTPETCAILAFALPAGQFAASQDGFEALAATLAASGRSTVLPPDPATDVRWVGDGSLGVLLPERWTVADAATLVDAASDARGTVESQQASGELDLRAQFQSWTAELRAAHDGLRLLSEEAFREPGRDQLRVRALWYGPLGPMVSDWTAIGRVGRRHCIRFDMSLAAYLELRADVDRAIADLRWR